MGLLNFFEKRERKVIQEYVYNVTATNYMNSDGSSRQEYIKSCKHGDELYFKPAPTKEYPDSIGIFTKRGKQIGVVGYQLLNELRQNYAKNSASVFVENIQQFDGRWSCSMKIKVYE